MPTNLGGCSLPASPFMEVTSMRPLTYILLFIFVTCIFTLVGAAEPGATPEETEKKCAAGGGCVLITHENLKAVVELITVQEMVIEELKKQLRKEKSKECV